MMNVKTKLVLVATAAVAAAVVVALALGAFSRPTRPSPGLRRPGAVAVATGGRDTSPPRGVTSGRAGGATPSPKVPSLSNAAALGDGQSPAAPAAPAATGPARSPSPADGGRLVDVPSQSPVVEGPTRGRPAAGPTPIRADGASGALGEGTVRVRARGQTVDVRVSPDDARR